MKKIKLSLVALMLSAAVISCKKDKPEEITANNNTVNADLANEQNASESNKTETSVLALGISIEGATKNTGTPPTPNGAIDFQLNTAETTAFQEVGFQIKFNTSSNIAGAYILFKDADGNKMGDYFDVPVAAFKRSSVSTPAFETRGVKNNLFLNQLSNNKTSVFGLREGEEDNVIDVDFENIPAGTFCYEIYLYDDQDNISNAEELCITVEAWGGNAEIVGEWESSQSFSNVNYHNSLTCITGGTILIDQDIYLYKEIVQDENLFIIEADGTMRMTSDFKANKELNLEETNDVCYTAYDDVTYESSTLKRGNYAYIEETNSLIFIVFYYQINQFDGVNETNETFSDGVDIYDFNNISLSNNKILIPADNPDDDLILSKK